MAAVYILYSKSMDRFYVGSCKDLKKRLKQHHNKEFDQAFTTKADDWSLFYQRKNLGYKTPLSL